MILHRTFTGIVGLYDDESLQDDVSPCVIAAFLKGFHPHGSPTLSFNQNGGYLKAAQSVLGEYDGKYTRFVAFKDLLQTVQDNQGMDYRLFVGQDNSAFCALIEEKLNEGWSTHGNIAMASMGEKDVIAQAVIKPAIL